MSNESQIAKLAGEIYHNKNRALLTQKEEALWQLLKDGGYLNIPTVLIDLNSPTIDRPTICQKTVNEANHAVFDDNLEITFPVIQKKAGMIPAPEW